MRFRRLGSGRFRRTALVAFLAVLVSGGALALLEPFAGDFSSDLSAPGSDVSPASGGGAIQVEEGFARSSKAGALAPTGNDLVSDEALRGGLGGLSLPAPLGARVLKEASLSVEVGRGRLDAAHRRALQLVAGAHGFVQSSNLEGKLVGLVVRVPADELESFVARLGRLGRVVEESISGEDVTAEFVDLEARLRHWRVQETVFLGLMAKARTIGETIEVQRQLSSVQEQIEQLEGRRRLLEDRSAMSTVRLTVAEPGVAVVVGPPTGLAAAWHRAWTAALAVVGGMLVVTGVLVPLGALALVVLFLARPILRRRPQAVGVAAPAAEGGAGVS